jgi:molecular chaperone DnaK
VTDPGDRKSPPRLTASVRIAWALPTSEEARLDLLVDVTASGGRILTEAPAEAGSEIRFDLFDEAEVPLGTGLALVDWSDPVRGMGVTFLSLGMDLKLLALLVTANRYSPDNRRARSSISPSGGTPIPPPASTPTPPAARPSGPPDLPPPPLARPSGPPNLPPSARPAGPPNLPPAARPAGPPDLPPVRPAAASAPVVPPSRPSTPGAPVPPSAKSGGAPPPLPKVVIVPEREAPTMERSLGVEAFDEVEPAIEPLAVRRTGVIIGIDLGTTNTCASYVVDGRPQIIPSRTGTNTIPSMITFDPDGTFHVGQRAADRQILHPLRTVYGSKRLLGRTYRPDLAAGLQQHFAFPIGPAEGQRFGALIDGRSISMDEIATRVLEEVRRTAEAHLKQTVEAAVITVPAYFTEVQREAVRRAAKEANLTVHRIVNEPTAAAVAYGHNLVDRARIAVWDFGGGTFDFSVVDVTEGQLEVVTTGGDCFVGGADFDDLVASFLLGEFQRAEQIDVDPDAQQIARLREAAEAAKRALSSETQHTVELMDFTRQPRRTLRVLLTRDRFNDLTRSIIQRTLAITAEVMGSRGLVPSDIDDVLLVGGSTRILAVQQAVGEFFQRRPSKRINPDEAVALGAALLADEIGSSRTPTLLDVLPMSVGRGTAGRQFEALVPRNHRLPAEREVTIDADLFGNVTMPLFQGESPDVARNEYLCSAVVEDPSLWHKGRVTLRVSFDEHCVMAIDARDARTGKPLAVTIDRTQPLDEILRALGPFEGPESAAWQLPESRIGKVLGKLFKLFGG